MGVAAGVLLGRLDGVRPDPGGDFMSGRPSPAIFLGSLKCSLLWCWDSSFSVTSACNVQPGCCQK